MAIYDHIYHIWPWIMAIWPSQPLCGVVRVTRMMSPRLYGHICGHIRHYMFIYGHIQPMAAKPCMAIYGHLLVWPYTAICGHILLYIAIYCYRWPYTVIFGHILLYIAIWSDIAIWPYTVIYGHILLHIWPYIAIYGHALLYMAVYCYTCHILLYMAIYCYMWPYGHMLLYGNMAIYC